MNQRVKTKRTKAVSSERAPRLTEETSLTGWPIDWHAVQERVRPYIVRIDTQHGSGTGFLFGFNAERSLAAIATAAHVVVEASEWKLPLKIIHEESGQEAFLTTDECFIDPDFRQDSASILMPAALLPFPKDVLPLLDEDSLLPVGTELGWMGYPCVDREDLLCFFTGRVSAFSHRFNYYQVDGVSINGVSGGPVFAPLDDRTPVIAGIISSYSPNVTDGDTLPGLLQARNISAFHETLKTVRSLDDAREKARKASPTPPVLNGIRKRREK